MELAFLALACPIGMGLMMWFMAKGMRRTEDNAPSEVTEPPSLDDLRAEQERLAAQISELDRDKTSHSAR